MIATLRSRINELNTIIRNATEERNAKMEELERLLHDEARKTELIGMITNANLNVEQLEAIVNSINGIVNTDEVPTIVIPGETVEVQTEPQSEVQSSENTITDEDGNECEITDEMRTSYITVVGVRHQHAWDRHHFSPAIGDHVILSKETATGNCWALYPEYEVEQHPELGEDIFLGVLPAATGTKIEQVRELGLPHKSHQSMWNNPDLDEIYVITGVIPGKFITLKKFNEESVDEDVEETSSNNNLPLNERLGINSNQLEEFDIHVSSEDEAREQFHNRMADHCVITSVDNIGSHFVINYDNMRCNTMEEVHRKATFPIILE